MSVLTTAGSCARFARGRALAVVDRRMRQVLPPCCRGEWSAGPPQPLRTGAKPQGAGVIAPVPCSTEARSAAQSPRSAAREATRRGSRSTHRDRAVCPRASVESANSWDSRTSIDTADDRSWGGSTVLRHAVWPTRCRRHQDELFGRLVDHREPQVRLDL